MIKRFIQAALVCALVALGGAVAAQPALADTTCPSVGYFCAWTSPNYTGTKTATNVNFTCQNFVSPIDNNISSLKVSATPNTGGWLLYYGYNCTGGFAFFAHGSLKPTLPAGDDNDFSSIEAL